MAAAGKLQNDDALAAAPTFNRLEITADRPVSRYHKIAPEPARLEALLLQLVVCPIRRRQREVVLNFDATHDPLHGKQEGMFFHGYYDSHCYLQLFAFIGDALVWAQLRTTVDTLDLLSETQGNCLALLVSNHTKIGLQKTD